MGLPKMLESFVGEVDGVSDRSSSVSLYLSMGWGLSPLFLRLR